MAPSMVYYLLLATGDKFPRQRSRVVRSIKESESPPLQLELSNLNGRHSFTSKLLVNPHLAQPKSNGHAFCVRESRLLVVSRGVWVRRKPE